jgi:hypothetical protein
MEVLISTFVLSIGLLGLAALLPVGRFAIVQSAKSDRAGACGRAGLRDVKVRRMLDWQAWLSQPQSLAPFAIDPLGATRGLPNTLAGVGNGIPRINLRWTPNRDLAENYFVWQDDKVFNIPDSNAERTRAQYTHGDTAVMDENPQNGMPAINGHYSWFCTVVPATGEGGLQPAEKTLFTVSVAVCYRRNFSQTPTADNPRTAEVATSATFIGNMPVYPGGGSLRLDTAVAVKENDWILLYAPVTASAPAQCNWYRVVGVGEDISAGNVTYLTVAGADWHQTNSTVTAVIVDSVIGVYTETVELDTGMWNR